MENRTLMILHVKNGDALLKKLSNGRNMGIPLALMGAALYLMYLRINEQDAKIEYLNRQLKVKELKPKGE